MLRGLDAIPCAGHGGGAQHHHYHNHQRRLAFCLSARGEGVSHGPGGPPDRKEKLFTKAGKLTFITVLRPSADNAPPYCLYPPGGTGCGGHLHRLPTCLGSPLMNGGLEIVPKTCFEVVERGKEYLS